MEANNVSKKLFKEMLRLKAEHSLTSCSVPILLSALYEVRGDDGEEFSNLFYVYFEKLLGNKPETNRNAFDKLIDKQKEGNDVAETIAVNFGEENLEIRVNYELKTVFDDVKAFMQINHRTILTPEYFWVVLFEKENSTAHKFVRIISANFMEAQNFFRSSKILGYEIIPYELSTFLYQKKNDGNECDIVGRDEVLNEIYRVMLKSSKRNVLLYGNAGVGKSATAEKFEYQIVTGNCPEAFKQFRVFELNVKDFILECDTTSKANEKMNVLMEFLRKREDDIILMIDEIQYILGKGGLFDSKKIDISAIMKPILSLGEVRIVGITTTADMTSFTTDPALSRRFETIKVKEPKVKEVKDMIMPRVRKIMSKKGVVISDELIEKAVWYAACYEFEKNNPDKSIDVIDRAMANTEMDGRTEVTHQDLLDVFNVAHKRWNGMTDVVKRNTAYHEAGHYILNRLTNPGDFEILAVSVMPTEDYCGINVFENNEEVTPVSNRQYFINEIACDLAGRIAEKMVSGEVSSGAAADLESATETAESMTTDLGLSSGKVHVNRSYWDDSMGTSEKIAEEIDKEINKAIREGTKLAEKLLKENEDILHAVAKALLKNHIMMAEELDVVWKKTVKARKYSGNSGATGSSDNRKNTTKNYSRKFKNVVNIRKSTLGSKKI